MRVRGEEYNCAYDHIEFANGSHLSLGEVNERAMFQMDGSDLADDTILTAWFNTLVRAGGGLDTINNTGGGNDLLRFEGIINPTTLDVSSRPLKSSDFRLC